MAIPLTKNQIYTYGDYLNWPGEERWELIEGVPFCMTPAPSTRHQRVVGEVFRQIANFLISRDCEVFMAPFDVRLPEADEADSDIRTVVQPDIVVVCDPAKLDDRGCKGPPDFVVEALSPSTASRDYIQKTALYEAHGVREYWIVSPMENTVTQYLLTEAGRYSAPFFHEGGGSMPVTILPGLTVNLDAVFGVGAGWNKVSS